MHENLTPRQMKLRSRPLSVALSPLEERAVKQAVQLTGDTVSAFIREAAVQRAERTLHEHAAPPLIRAA